MRFAHSLLSRRKISDTKIFDVVEKSNAKPKLKIQGAIFECKPKTIWCFRWLVGNVEFSFVAFLNIRKQKWFLQFFLFVLALSLSLPLRYFSGSCTCQPTTSFHVPSQFQSLHFAILFYTFESSIPRIHHSHSQLFLNDLDVYILYIHLYMHMNN